MSEEDVVAGEWGTEIEAEGWLMLKVCELNVQILAWYTRRQPLINKALRTPARWLPRMAEIEAFSERQKRPESPMKSHTMFTAVLQCSLREGDYNVSTPSHFPHQQSHNCNLMCPIPLVRWRRKRTTWQKSEGENTYR